MAKKKSNWWTQNRLLIFGILAMGLGIYRFGIVWNFESNLIQIKGTIREADTYVTTLTSRHRQQETHSQVSVLIFYMVGRQQKFYLSENIGDKVRNEKYEKILRGLKRADSVTVWLDESEVNEYEPLVLRIDTDNTTLLGFEAVRTERKSMTAFMLLLGFILILSFVWQRFPEKLTIFGTPDKTS